MVLVQAQLLPWTSMSGFTRVPSGAFKQWTPVTFIKFMKCVVSIRGDIKKQVFFEFFRTSETPSPSLSIWMPKFFLIRKFWIWTDPPFWRKIPRKKTEYLMKKNLYFMMKPFWNRWDPPFPPLWPKKSKKISVFSAKEILDSACSA